MTSNSNIDDLLRTHDIELRALRDGYNQNRLGWKTDDGSAEQDLAVRERKITTKIEQAIQQELLKARIETLEWLLEQEVEFGGLELKQSIIDKVAELQKELKENSDG